MKKNILIIIILLFSTNCFASELENIEVHGFLAQGFLKTDKNNYLADTEEGTGDFNEMGINFGKKMSPRMRIGVQFFARDLGDVGNNEVEIDWFYADYYYKEWLGLRVGVMKRPVMGMFNENRDLDNIRTSILLPQSNYFEGIRDSVLRTNGVSLYGTLDAKTAGLLRYTIMYGEVHVPSDGSTSQFTADVVYNMFGLLAETTSIDVERTFSMRIDWLPPIDGLDIAFTYSNMPLDYNIKIISDIPASMAGMIPETFTIETKEWKAYSLSFEYLWSNLTFTAEATQVDTKTTALGQPANDNSTEHWYVSVAYRFTDWFELGSYYCEQYLDKDDKDGSVQVSRGKDDFRAWHKDLTFSARFDLSENWVAKVEVHSIDGAALIPPTMNIDTNTNQPSFERNWTMYAAKLSYTF